MLSKTWTGIKMISKIGLGLGVTTIVIFGYYILTYGNKKDMDKIEWYYADGEWRYTKEE